MQLTDCSAREHSRRPQPSLHGVKRMTDGCGILQHSSFNVPDRRHGYCLDDNARALILMTRLPGVTNTERDALISTFAAFVESAWNEKQGCFRNFLSYERIWLEEKGSEDSIGRGFWAVAAVAADGRKTTHRHWAKTLVDRVSPNINTIAWPRSDAFVMLGLSALASAGLNTELVMALLAQKSDRLANNLQRARTSDWVWFEDYLTYDNARLPEALIRAGTVLRDSNKIGLGLESLGWLCRRQTSSEGFFRPTATEDFNRKRESIALFDQQPLEAAATIDACQAAWLIDRQPRWIKEAESAYEWYFGANDLGVALVDAGDGECYDGLTNTGLNLNQGAESLVSLQLATCTLQTLPIL